MVTVFGQPLSFYLPAQDPDGDQMFFSAGGLPDNAKFSPDTGFLAGFPGWTN